MHGAIEQALILLTHELRAAREQREAEAAWHRSHAGLATKLDLDQLEKRIMSQLNDLITAATTLSTASDGLSVKLDNLVAKVDAVVAALQGADLPAAGEAALTALKTSAAQAAKSGDAVDAEVAKLDGVLPTPAPAAPAV